MLESLTANLADGTVHRSLLPKPPVAPSHAEINQLLVTNWGRIPRFRLPSGLRANDFRASARSARMQHAPTAPATFFVNTYDDRLSVEHPAWVTDETDPTLAWREALGRSFGRITG